MYCHERGIEHGFPFTTFVGLVLSSLIPRWYYLCIFVFFHGRTGNIQLCLVGYLSFALFGPTCMAAVCQNYNVLQVGGVMCMEVEKSICSTDYCHYFGSYEDNDISCLHLC